jgi:hypothetical protein
VTAGPVSNNRLLMWPLTGIGPADPDHGPLFPTKRLPRESRRCDCRQSSAQKLRGSTTFDEHFRNHELLITADLHFRIHWFRWLIEQAPDFDLVCIAGDLLDNGLDRESAKAAMSVSPERKKSRNSKPWYSHVSQILRSTK